MTEFNPAMWKEAGAAIEKVADALYRSAEGIALAEPLVYLDGASPIDAAIIARDGKCCLPWHNLVGAANDGLTSLGSKMTATGNDYEATEEGNIAAAKRFWEVDSEEVSRRNSALEKLEES
ncbi:hypothetical protein HMPREF1531_02064 [Propionibacterium sp. oral taxon 192 str. F0372]|uniref:hypothetical protein n=1 Tax=Propionibacterium sp. oral taxon 192 TaxID=671222 RepID=UPI0003530B2D|nr:hypothetical protein [Propionibacterium sp. oral taxon 192]EPH02753.1 hypothetical protein HMPREF1531_02064 [Propionibacterium sp. oral taxon 192 str. F0372]